MKNYRIKFNLKNIKTIPKRDIAFMAMFCILALICLVEICLPVYRVIDNAREYDIHIDKAYVRYRSKRGAKELVIVSDGQKYFLRYPRGEYRECAGLLRDNLLSGKIQEVTVKAADDSDLFGRIAGNRIVVKMERDSTVYYDTDTARQYMRQIRVSAWAGFIMFSAFSAAVIAFGMACHKVVCVEKK